MSDLLTAVFETLEALEALEAGHSTINGTSQAARAIAARRQALEQQPAQYSDIVSDGGLDPRNKFDVQHPATCTWSQVDDIHTPDTWEADCGALWTFTDGGPKDNNMRFCPKCGKHVQQKGGE